MILKYIANTRMFLNTLVSSVGKQWQELGLYTVYYLGHGC